MTLAILCLAALAIVDYPVLGAVALALHAMRRPVQRPTPAVRARLRSFAALQASTSSPRVWVAASLFAVALWPTSALAQTLSEAEVIRLARAQDPAAIAASEAAAVAEAERLEATLYPNPTIGWEHEHFPQRGVPDDLEDAWVLTVPIDLSSRRGIRGHLARAHAVAVKAEALRTRSDVVTRALMLFYELVGERRRGVIEQRALERLIEATRVVTRRREEGDVSGYEQARVEIEAELAASTSRETEARALRLRAELALLLGVDGKRAQFSGDLEQDNNLIARPTTGSRRVNPPSTALLRAASASAREALDATTWTWVPMLSISAGPRIALGEQRRTGYMLGASIDLPVFSRGQGLRAQAEAHERRTLALAGSAEREARIAQTRAGQLLIAARQEAQRFDDAVRDRIERLERAAESGYREGQLSIADLVDARNARTTIETRRLELALTVKRAEVALRAARGEFE